MTEYPPEYVQALVDCVIGFEAILPDLKEILGDDNPVVIEGEEAMKEVKDELIRMGVYPQRQ